MAHYAFLDQNNLVTEVIVGRDENDLPDGVNSWEEYYGEIRQQKCLRTSYNSNIRKNFAGIGYFYDEDIDAFIPPQPFPSWILNTETAKWKAPKEYPDKDKLYLWNEDVLDWEEAPFGVLQEPKSMPITFDKPEMV